MKFDEWFEEQYGPDPNPEKGVRELDLAAMEMRSHLHSLEGALGESGVGVRAEMLP